MSTIIEINQDLSDLNYILINQKALELWEFQKQQSEMCNNCDRSDFTSDLQESKTLPDPEDLFWYELERHNKKKTPSTPNGFWFNGIWMELEDGEVLKGVMEEIKNGIKREHAEEIREKIQKREKEEYWILVKKWKREGMKYEHQPCYTNGQLLYSPDECEAYQRRCKNKLKCNIEHCNPDSCLEYQSLS